MPRKEEYLTPEGLKRLQDEMRDLRDVRRPEVAARINTATQSGGTVDNAEYDEAKSAQGFVEGRIRELENILANAVVAERTDNPDAVGIGSRVTVKAQGGKTQRGKTQRYVVVGSAEASPLQGKISYESPVGSALLGKAVGDEVEVDTPARVVRLRITRIE